MTKKQKIKEQIKSLRDLIADLEFSLVEEEDVGKTDETEKKKNNEINDLEELRKRIDEIQKGGGPSIAPYYPDKYGYNCAVCGTWVYNNFHNCSGKRPFYPWNDGSWTCRQCGARVGMLQVHTCPWNPGITYVSWG